MPANRERGVPLEPEQRDFIEEKLREEGITIKAAAAKYLIGETTLRNALNGKGQDYNTLEDIILKFCVPDVNRLKERHQRLFNLQRERNVYFTGRESQMKALCQALEGSPFVAVTQALAGMGGIGKTSTAIEYACRCLDKAHFKEYPRYKAIQFARADTADVLKYGYASIANALRLPRADPDNPEEAVQAMLRWMMRPEKAPWLLILDNVEDPDLLNEFLPREPQRHYGHVLITSRSNRFAHRISRVNIEQMDREEAVAFLCKRTGRELRAASKEHRAARALVAEMDGLPLALEQAAAYMTHGEEMSFEDYLSMFRDQIGRSQLLMQAPEYGFYLRFQPETRAYTEALTVLTTWQMSLKRIEADHSASIRLLHLCAFLHPAGIPRELVFALLPDYFASAGEDPVQKNLLYNGLLNVLTGYSLIQRNLTDATHRMHALLQTVLWDGLKPPDRQQACETILRAVARSFPSEDYVQGGRGALYYPHAERIHKYVRQNDMQSEPASSLLNHMGAFLYRQGRFEEGEPILREALAIRRKTLSEGHVDIAESLSHLGRLYRYQGRFEKAEPLLKEALAIRQYALTAGHLDIADSLNNLGRLYRYLGRFAEAEPLLKEALAMRRKALPGDHPDIAAGLNHLARLYEDQGRLAEAEPLYLQALAMRQRALPEDHPKIAETLNNLGGLYQSQGRSTEAELLLKEALAMHRKALPEGHPNIATSFSYLARLYEDQGRLADAVPLYQQALAMRRQILPEDHPKIAEVQNHLASLYKRSQ